LCGGNAGRKRAGQQDYEVSSTVTTASAASRCWAGNAGQGVTTYASATSNLNKEDAGHETTASRAGACVEQRRFVGQKSQLTAKDVRAGDYPDEKNEAWNDDRGGNEA
jgi:2-keto-4-pentenoate hydratase